MSQEIESLKYPIGRYKKPEVINLENLNGFIEVIGKFPARLNEAVVHLRPGQLDTPYRPDGWTIRQVVHHCADSHLNSVMRFKLALTEDKPIIKPYHEDRWALLADSINCDPVVSLKILEGLHDRWVILLKSMTNDQWEKTFIHPEHGRVMVLKEVAALYAWHCEHHLAHITSLKGRKGWV